MGTGYADNLYGPAKFGGLELVLIQATFDSGVATVDTVNSSPGVTLVKDTTGDYDFTCQKGSFIHYLGGGIDLASDTPADTIAKTVNPRSLTASTGTGKLIFTSNDDGEELDPANGCRVYAAFLVGRF